MRQTVCRAHQVHTVVEQPWSRSVGLVALVTIALVARPLHHPQVTSVQRVTIVRLVLINPSCAHLDNTRTSKGKAAARPALAACTAIRMKQQTQQESYNPSLVLWDTTAQLQLGTNTPTPVRLEPMVSVLLSQKRSVILVILESFV